MGNIKLWVNGTQIEAAEGQTVLRAALAAGIYIPHLCSHPDLEAQGGCKLCVIEVDGDSSQPVTSCTTTVRDGMKVVTKSEGLDKLRRTAMEFMLAGHPHDCTGCRSYGNCELQAMMQYLSVVNNPGMREVHKHTTRLNINNPLIDREMERCIQCGRCVRACSDLRGVGILDYRKKNGEVYIGTEGDRPLAEVDCRFCGACVEVCPTGALQDKTGVFRTDVTRDKALIPCSLECPAHINIPGYLYKIHVGKYDEAVAVIREKVPFPHALGYVCTHYCEKGCKRKGLGDAVAIRDLKRFAVEHDESQMWKKSAIQLPPTGKRVAVIGGGPAGLTAGYYLAKKGHQVTVMEREPVAGGMMAVGIPAYRLPRADLQREVDVIVAAGVKLQTGVTVENAARLKGEYDAVLVAVGAAQGKTIPLAGYRPEQCTTALKLLKAAALDEPTPLVGPGKQVVVIGGGNVAFDAVRTALRLGATVQQVCLEARNDILADLEEIEGAVAEGAQINPGKNNLRFVTDESGVITGLEIEDVKGFSFQEGRLTVDAVADTQRVLAADTIVFATGQKTDLTVDFGLELNRFGYPVYDKDTLQTPIPGVFVAGDVVTGTKAVIDAIVGGRTAAQSMDQFLGGDGNIDEQLTTLDIPSTPIGKLEGFAALERQKAGELEAQLRCQSFDKIDQGLTCDQAQAETERCLKCPMRTGIVNPKMWTAYANR